MRDRIGAVQAFRYAQGVSPGNFPEQIFVDSLGSYNAVPYMSAKGWNPQLVSNCGIAKGFHKQTTGLNEQTALYARESKFNADGRALNLRSPRVRECTTIS